MRTTLKRGIGRGAAFNGNGHAVLPPAPGGLPPSAPPPEVRRYVQPQPERGGSVRTILGFFLLGVVTIVGGVIGGLYLSAHDALNDMSAHSVGVKRAQVELAELSQPNQPAVAL